MGNSTKELVNAFNLNNYGVNEVNTNFTVEGKKIVGLFTSGTNIGKYLQGIREEIIKQHYLSGTEVASEYYNLNCFPFVLGANPDKEDLGHGIVKVKLADSTNNEVIRNLKVHFANEFKRAVKSKVVARLQKAGITKEGASEWVIGTVGTGAIGSPYLYCIAFSNEYLEKRYNPRIFELLKSLYIREFNSRLEACGLKSSDFYEYKDGMLYIKNVSDKVIKSVTEYVKGRVALDFRTPGSVESKVENCKNVLNDLIFESTGKSIYGYDYDDFTDEKEIKNGHSFVLIPFIEENGQLKSLSFNDASKINEVFNKEIPNVDDNFISDIRGKTANPQFANCKEPVYAFSNKQIALLLPMIMQSPIAYNERNGRFEFAVDLRSQQFVFPTPPLTPVPNRHRNSDEKPGPSFELSQLQPMDSPRQGSEKEEGRGLRALHNQLGLAVAGPSARMSSIVVNPGISGPSSKSLSAAQNVPAAWSHDPWSPQSTSGNKWQPSPKPGTSGLSWKGTNESGSASTSAWSSSAPSAGFSSWKGAAQNVQASTNLWTQQPNRWSLQSTSENKWPLPTQSGDSSYPQQSFSRPIRFSSRGSRLPLYVRPLSVHSEDSGLGSSRPASTSSTLYSADSGFGSRPQSTFNYMSNYENQEELTEKELIINKFLKNVKEIAAKNIEGNIEVKQTLTKEKIHEYIEGFAKLEKADQPYQYCISFDEEYFKSKESRAKSIFNIFKDNYITVLDSALNRCDLKNSDSYKYKNDKLYIKDINVIKKIAENARMPDRELSPEWTQVGANKCRTSKEEELTQALLDVFNIYNYIFGEVPTNFTLEDGKIVSLLGDNVDTTKYLEKVRSHIIENCGTEEERVAKKVYDMIQFPFVFPPDPRRKKGEKIIIAHNIDAAIPNLKVHLIQNFRRQVEEEVAKKREKREVTEARNHIKDSVFLRKLDTSCLCYVFLGDCFKGKSGLFKEFENIYVEAFKSRWKECGLDDSLVSYDNGCYI